jgi:hypothetical protein
MISRTRESRLTCRRTEGNPIETMFESLISCVIDSKREDEEKKRMTKIWEEDVTHQDKNMKADIMSSNNIIMR